MQAIKRIIEVKNHTFTVVLPNDFMASSVEVIILPSNQDNDIPEWHKAIIDKRLKDYKQNPDDVTDFDVFCDELEKENL
jgi:Putative addiction module component